MHALYLASVWLHLIAVAIWLGGSLFLVLVVVPWLRRQGREHAGALLRETGTRFRTVGWICFVTLLCTGTFNLWVRGVRLSSFMDPEWLRSPFGSTVLLKLGAFAAVLALSAVHDFWLGPRAADLMDRAPDSDEAAAARRGAARLGRANVILALILVAAGVMLVRGRPW